MNDKKYFWIIRAGLLLSVIILAVLFLSPKVPIDQQKIITWILIFSVIFVGLYLIFHFIALFIKKLAIWSSTFNTALIIYLGFLVFSLARYKELLSEILKWDAGMAALGIAIFAFGWSFVRQHLQEQTTKRDYQKLESSVSKLSRKLSTLNRKIDSLRK